MNKPVSFICACLAGLGFLVLSKSIYCTVVYGHGDMEAGNFHRCVYSTTRDPATGSVHRDYDVRWELVESTEGSPLARIVDMWFVGIGLIVAGVSIYVVEWSTGGGRPAF